jgi:WD40 repeat protein
MRDVYTVCLNDTILATGSSDKVCIWDLRNPSIVIETYKQAGRALAWEKRRRNYLCAGGKDERITIWNTQGNLNRQYISADGPIT